LRRLARLDHLAMPPKAMKAKPAPKPKKEPKKSPVPASIVEAIDVADADAAPEFDTVAQSEAKSFKKCVSDNFKGWGPTLLKLTFIDGLNLEETLKRDRERVKTDADFSMGKFYYSRKREIFGGTSPEMVVPIHDESEVDDNKLHQVRRHALSHNKRLEPLSEYVKSCKDMTQKNIAALLRGVLRLSPSSSVENATVLLDVLDFLLRLDTPRKFPETFEPCRPHFDAAALKTLVFCRKISRRARCGGFGTEQLLRHCFQSLRSIAYLRARQILHPSPQTRLQRTTLAGQVRPWSKRRGSKR
jgi:hypothetical protein